MKNIERTSGEINYNFNGFAITKPKVKIPSTARKGGGKRGSVEGFSFQSCLRLRRTLLSADYSKSCFGMAITFRAGTLPCMILRRHAQVSKHISRLPIDAIIWRLEQTRVGTLHFHFIVWASDEMNARHAICRAYELNENYFVNASEQNVVRNLDNRKSICYLSAHQAKRKQYQVVHMSGVRPWGVFGRQSLPILPFETLKIGSDRVFYRIFRSYQKFLLTQGQCYVKVRFDDGRHLAVLNRLVKYHNQHG